MIRARSYKGQSGGVWVGTMLACLSMLSGFAQADRAAAQTNQEAESVVLENDLCRWVIEANGQTSSFFDLGGNQEYVDKSSDGLSIAYLFQDDVKHQASSIQQHDDELVLGFETLENALLTLRVEKARRYFELSVEDYQGPAVETICFLNVPLRLQATDEERFAAAAMALDVQCLVYEIPQPMSNLAAFAYPKTGIKGATVAIVGCPRDMLRDVMKQVIRDTPGIPRTDRGGPWARDAACNFTSYLTDMRGEINESNIGEWTKLARAMGFSQIDFHTGHSLRFGDYEPDPEVFPDGFDSVKRVVDSIHDAGMLAGFHTYAFFIAKDTPWVTPVPDPGLAKKRTFTLAADISEKDTRIPVLESLAGVSPVTGFHVRNSATLQIDDELIVFNVVQTDDRQLFTQCERGAWGTTPAAHAADAKVYQLHECFGLFVPDPDSPLFEAVIQRSADVYNRCGFDMIYLDAIDGADIFSGWPHAWHYAARFTWELARRLERPAIFEMSMLTHHLWYVRSRMGAWDVPARAARPFIDMHTLVNEACEDYYMPTQLGWWAVFDFARIQPERTFPEDLEYLCCKSLAHRSGLSMLLGFSPERYRNNESIRRYARLLKTYEQLRREGNLPDETRSQLKKQATNFTLTTTSDNEQVFQEIAYFEHKVQGLDGWSDRWEIEHSFEGDQPAGIRIEALASLERYGSPNAMTLTDFSEMMDADHILQDGVTSRLTWVEDENSPIDRFACFEASQERDTRHGSWAGVRKTFSPYCDMSGRGIGVWVRGDGKGELINIQMNSPAHRSGGISERYINVDFEGWRYFEFVEPTSDEVANYDWPYFIRRERWEEHKPHLMQFAYPAFHIWVYYPELETLTVWYNNLPTEGGVRCLLSPIRALPLVDSPIVNPEIEINGSRIVFKTSIPTGHYIQLEPDGKCWMYDRTGNRGKQVEYQGKVLQLAAGRNRVRFTCEEPEQVNPRAAVTLIARGKHLPVSAK